MTVFLSINLSCKQNNRVSDIYFLVVAGSQNLFEVIKARE